MPPKFSHELGLKELSPMNNYKFLPATKTGLRFDWCASINEDFILTLSKRVITQLQRYQSTRGISTLESQERAERQTNIAIKLLSALYSGHTIISSDRNPRPISFPRDSSVYKQDSSCIEQVPYSYRNVCTVYKALISMDWIKVAKGTQGTAYSRIYAHGELADIFTRVGLRWLRQTPHPPESLICLRDRVKPSNAERSFKQRKNYHKVTLETPDTADVHKMASNLFRYNQFLSEHCIAFDLPDHALYEIAKAMADDNADDKYKPKYLDFSRIQLRRIFSRGDMTKGGRFYGGWWQGVPSKEKSFRSHITINGERTCEVDYSSVCLRIVYSLKGITIDPEEDLYDIGLPGWSGAKDSRRQPVKTYINAIMNDEDGNYRLSKSSLAILEMTHDQLHELVLRRHKPIREELIAGIGLTTQFIDSRIAEDIMLTMVDLGVLVLPIHDSFIVKAKHQRLLENTMLESFKTITGHPGSVDSTSPRLPEHFGLSDEEYSRLPGYLKDLGGNLSRTHTNTSIMGLFLKSWRANSAYCYCLAPRY